jgi:histidyl-tRNA synthetase
MAEFQRPRGTRDFTQEEMRIRRWAELRMRKAIGSFGYSEIATPTFEHTDLFIAKSGPQVLEQIYEFEDKGGRSLSLRPELTAPVMRFYQSDLRNFPKPLRISYFGNCFRYERPQKGRYREFWQMGLEYIGKRTPMAISEVIEAAVAALESIGLKGYIVRVGHVALLRSILEVYDVDPKTDKDLMIAIDKKDTDGIRSCMEGRNSENPEALIDLVTKIYGSDSYHDTLMNLLRVNDKTEPEIREIETVLSIMESSPAEIRLDPSISRGLDYYDGIVFEIDSPDLGAEKQICGGGAYSLSSVFGSEVEGIGFGLGFDRILVAIDKENIDAEEPKIVYLMPVGEKAEKEAFSLADRIRGSGLNCILETSGRVFKKSISSAVSSGCSHLLFVGEEELSRGVVSVKDLRSKDQKEIPMEELMEHLLNVV